MWQLDGRTKHPLYTPKPLSAHHPKNKPDYVKHRLGRGTSGFTCCLLLHTPLPHHIRTVYTNLLFWGCVLLLFMVLLLLMVGLGVCVRVGCVCGVGSGSRCVASCHANVGSPLCKATLMRAASASPIHECLIGIVRASALFLRWVSVV